jgi:hypothetical protein
MAPPTLTAQTGLYTNIEQRMMQLKRRADQGDLRAQQELQQLQQRTRGLSDFVYDDTSKDLTATMPQRDYFAEQLDYQEELDRRQPKFLQDLLVFGQEDVRRQKERKAQEKAEKGLQALQEENKSSTSQYSIGKKPDESSDDTPKVGLASANNPNLTDSKIMDQFQEQLEEVLGVQPQEFKSTFGDPITLRTRDEIREDVSSRLNLPEVSALKPTEAERQRDMNVALLTGLGAVIGGAKRPGDIATGIGKLGSDIAKMRRDARKEDRLADRLTRQEQMQNINLITGIVNAEQTSERLTKQLQMAEKKDFDSTVLAQEGLKISKAKLIESGLRLQLAEQAQIQGMAKFELDQIRALQAQVSNLTSTLATDPTLITDTVRAAQIQGQIDAINEEVNRRFSVPEVEKEIKEIQTRLKQAQEQKQ